MVVHVPSVPLLMCMQPVFLWPPPLTTVPVCQAWPEKGIERPQASEHQVKQPSTTRVRLWLYARGFPYGTEACRALETDLHAFFSNWAPVECVVAHIDAATGWTQGVYVGFVHPIYAQAVLDGAPYVPFYGLFLCIEPVRGEATLRIRFPYHELDTYPAEQRMPSVLETRTASLLAPFRRDGQPHTAVSGQEVGASLMQLVNHLAECYGDIQQAAEVEYGQDRVLDITFTHRTQAAQALDVRRLLIQGASAAHPITPIRCALEPSTRHSAPAAPLPHSDLCATSSAQGNRGTLDKIGMRLAEYKILVGGCHGLELNEPSKRTCRPWIPWITSLISLFTIRCAWIVDLPSNAFDLSRMAKKDPQPPTMSADHIPLMSCTCRSTGWNFSLRMLTMRFCLASGEERSSLRAIDDEAKLRMYAGLSTAVFPSGTRCARSAWRTNMLDERESHC